MSRLPLNVFTLALDSMPWIACIYSELIRLHDIEWQWTIVEGAAMNENDTAWCAKQAPRLSSDGTTEFLDAIAYHPRVRIIRREKWHGKMPMCNEALRSFPKAGLLLEVDSDELWRADQLRLLVDIFEDNPTIGSAIFTCRYFVGPNIITTDEADWRRAWRFEPADYFLTHEPPIMARQRGTVMSRQDTKRLGLVFDHQSWTLPKHVAQKEAFYGPSYRGAAEGWKRLQQHAQFPATVKQFFPWSAPTTIVDRVFPS